MLPEEPEVYAEWTTAFVNDLPDSSFLYIAPGGEKDDDGRTKPRGLRYFPYRDASGKVDLPHLRNAIARIPQSTAPGLDKEKMASLQAKARKMLDAERPEEAAAEFAAPVALGETDDRWVELARSGSHFGRASERKVDLGPDDIESMARGYKVIQSERWFSTGAPVGYNHASINGAVDPESTKAAGRIVDVQVRANDDGTVSLYGLIRWTDEARGRIRAGEFDGFSIEAVPSDHARSKKTGEPLGEWALIGGTLTNEPFVAGMQAVAASETPTTVRKSMSLIKLLSAPLSLDERATEAQVVSSVQALSEKAARADVLAEALDSVTTDRDELRVKFSDLEAKETDRMLDRACEDGRISASQRDRYLRHVRALGEEDAHDRYPMNLVPTSPVGDAGNESARATSAPAITGIDNEIRALADTIVSDDGLSSAAAYARAMQTVLSDPTKLAAYEAASFNS